MITLLSLAVIAAIVMVIVGILAVLLDILGAIGVGIALPVAIVGKEFLILVGGLILFFAWMKSRKK